uniref:Hva1_TUDOR domain-containing protein n=1 Tax=Heterorhabditis bacteriophora TaxID=37862 RepID=A0A1I7XA78_HETBA
MGQVAWLATGHKKQESVLVKETPAVRSASIENKPPVNEDSREQHYT